MAKMEKILLEAFLNQKKDNEAHEHRNKPLTISPMTPQKKRGFNDR
jgi:hypothetical protein